VVSEGKPQRLGLRGRLAHFESALRLLGGANATGAIAAGAAFHAFKDLPDVQGSIKLAGVLFLGGIFTFVVAYVGLFIATDDIDHSLHNKDEPTWPNYLWWVPNKTQEEYKAAAKRNFIVALLVGLASFFFLLFGLVSILLMAVHLQFS
jgi:hypothetical protein